MKHKYLIEKNEEKNELIIKEFAELDKEMLSYLCQETYAEEKITAAMANGREALIAALRTPNMYPSGLFANKIAEAVMTMYASEPSQSLEIIIDDIDFITKDKTKKIVFDGPKENSTNIDDLLEDDFDEDFDDKPPTNKINSSLKVMDDDYNETDDDSEVPLA